MIIHFTTLHSRTDTRIRLKQVASLAVAFDVPVELYVQDGLGDEWVDDPGFWIRDTGARPAGRLKRMTVGAWRMYMAIRRARPMVAHFHDPELLPWALLLRGQGIKVVYDVHEDLPAQIQHKHYLPRILKKPLGLLVSSVERFCTMFINGCIVVVPEMLRRFPSGKTALVSNFPSLTEFAESKGLTSSAREVGRFAYVGGITEARGINMMIQSLEKVKDDRCILSLHGAFAPESLENLCKKEPGWKRVRYHGWASRQQVLDELSYAQAGLVILKAVPNYLIAYPVKMFEYMAAGLPVIASDFPLWREIVDSAQCGLLVDPEDPQAIADAMQWIIDHPEEAQQMGQRGRQAVEEKYNWNIEAAKLIDFYETQLSVPLNETKP